MLEPFRSPAGQPLSSTSGPPLNTFVRLPREKLLFTSPPRTTLEITIPNASSTNPGKEPISVHCASGVLYLTNQRIIYLPLSPTPRFQSFSAPILNLQDTHVYAPFFGANAWHGMLKCVPGGGINARHGFVEVKMTFKEGGAYDFADAYEKVKEQIVQQRELANEIGAVGTGDVTLEPLPVYEARDSGRNPAESAPTRAPGYEARENGSNSEAPPTSVQPGLISTPEQLIDVEGGERRASAAEEGQGERIPRPAPPIEPNEPPPAYEA